jgi:hypothetical protein
LYKEISINILLTQLQVKFSSFQLTMSRNIKSNSSNTIQKYCKVCHDAGKSEAEFRSHFTRTTSDPKSTVICPTLLALECRFCFKNGHTVKYCPTIKEREKVQKREETSSRRVDSSNNIASSSKSKIEPKNAFACLDCDSDDEEQNVSIKSSTKVEVKEEFPQLCAPIQRSFASINYAAALSAPAPTPAPKLAAIVNQSELNVGKTSPTKYHWEYNNGPTAGELDWAAMDSDSDSDDEEPIVTNNGYDSDW